MTLAATTITLTSMLQIDGETTLTMSNFGTKGFATLEPGNGTAEEQISFTGIVQNANGTATLTGVSNVLMVAPYTESSGTSMSHPGGVILVISNTSGFYNRIATKDDDETITGLWTFPNNGNTPVLGVSYVAPTTDLQIPSKKYVDDVAVSGAPNAAPTVKGIVQEATVSQVNSGTATGSTGAVLFASPADLAASIYGLQLPSSTEKTAMDGGALNPSGAIIMYGGSAAPTGWLLCDGTSYLRATYPALFTAISTTYGSADGTHFNVPDMRGRSPMGVGTGTGGGTSGTGLPTGGTALTAVALATWRGSETHTITQGELPSYNLVFPGSVNQGAIGAGGTIYSGTGTTNVPSGGSGTAANIENPAMGVQFIIKI